MIEIPFQKEVVFKHCSTIVFFRPPKKHTFVKIYVCISISEEKKAHFLCKYVVYFPGSATFSFFRYCSITDDWNRIGFPFSRPFFPDFLVIGNTTEKEKNLLAKNKKSPHRQCQWQCVLLYQNLSLPRCKTTLVLFIPPRPNNPQLSFLLSINCCYYIREPHIVSIYN